MADPVKIGIDVEDFASIDGETVRDKIETAVNADTVVVFGRSTCPFCIEVTRTMMSMGVHFRYYKMDKMGGDIPGSTVLEELREYAQQKTVPMVFINGNLVGGLMRPRRSLPVGSLTSLLGVEM
eukprot:jgi/Picre1/33091/NNA_008417.t1